MVKIDIFGVLALLGSIVVAALFGGVLYAIARSSPLMDIVALIVVFLMVAFVLYIFFFRSDKGKSEDVVWMTIGGVVGLIAYPVLYIVNIGIGDLSIAETIVSAILIVLGIAGIALLLKVRKEILG